MKPKILMLILIAMIDLNMNDLLSQFGKKPGGPGSTNTNLVAGNTDPGTNPILSGTVLDNTKKDTRTDIEKKLDVQRALYPNAKDWTTNKTNVAQNNISSTGTIPGNQVTKTENVKVKQGATGGRQTTDQGGYMADLAKRFPGASGEELAKKIPGSKGSYISKEMIDSYNKNHYKPKTITTGNPDKKVKISEPLSTKEAVNTGENASNTDVNITNDEIETMKPLDVPDPGTGKLSFIPSESKAYTEKDTTKPVKGFQTLSGKHTTRKLANRFKSTIA